MDMILTVTRLKNATKKDSIQILSRKTTSKEYMYFKYDWGELKILIQDKRTGKEVACLSPDEDGKLNIVCTKNHDETNRVISIA